MKLIREHINEKFIEDGDPIHQMGIGLIDQLKKEYIKDNSYDWYKITPENITLEDLLEFCLPKNKYGLDVIEALISAGVNLNDKDHEYLRYAVLRGMDFMKFLLDKGVKANSNRSMALGLAIQYKNFDIAEFLIQRGASVKAVGSEQLANAIRNNDITTIKWLIKRGANPNAFNYRALRQALKEKKYDMADMFAEEYIKDRKKT
jgi:ankyrin repeat protein